MMQLMQMNSSPAQSLEQPLDPKEKSKEVSKEAAEFAAMVSGAQALVSVPATAEKSQETRQVAASLNTAALIAGQQPWSKGWVFQGADKNPGLNPLIGDALSSDPEALKTQMEAAQKTAPRSLMDLLSSESPEVEKGQKVLESGFVPQRAQSPEMAAVVQGKFEMPEMSQMQGLGELNEGPDSELLSQIQSGEPMLGELSEDFSERRGLEAGKSAPRKFGTAAFAKRSDATGQAPQVMARPQLVSGADFMSMKGLAQGAGRSPMAAAAAKLAGQSEKSDSLREEILGRMPVNSAGSDAAGLTLVQSSERHAPQNIAAIPLKLEVNGNVVPGAGMQDRLTSESVVGMSQTLMRLGAQGGGEMRLKLKPDALGEVRIGVISHGNSVSLQIHALDEKAKRIVEESLGSLKDALASHSLTLAKVDLQVSSQPVLATQSQLGAEMDQGQRHNGQNAFNSFEGQRDSRGHSEGGSQSSRERLGLAVARAQAFGPTRTVGAEGRLDVRA